jgi:hypothetical protein
MDEAYEELRKAIADELAGEVGNFSEIARITGLDTDSVTKMLDRQTVSYSTLKKMLEGFGLELTESSYVKQSPPNQTPPTTTIPSSAGLIRLSRLICGAVMNCCGGFLSG